MVNEENKFKIILDHIQGAHRSSEKNKLKILEKLYLPGMSDFIEKYTIGCDICQTSKYDHYILKATLLETLIPNCPTEILHAKWRKNSNLGRYILEIFPSK